MITDYLPDNDDALPQGLIANSRSVIEAVYRKPELPAWEGYPCIEALPALISRQTLFEQIQVIPQFSQTIRKQPAHVRAHMVMDILHFFQPLSIHAKLEGMVSRSIHDGYRGRNPLDARQVRDVKARLEYFRTHPLSQSYDTNSASGFLICGMSGVGKSTSLRRILDLYPQIILHKEYRARKFTQAQLVHLTLECPKDGSTKGLCIDFFKTIDFIFGGETTYASAYGSENRATNQLMQSMATLASALQIGLIVIDEIQYLNVAKSGGAEELLNFFVRLVNIIGVPVVLVGTYDAYKLVSPTFRHARRCSGQGDVIWEPLLSDHDDWKTYVKSLWECQYLAKKSLLTDQLSETLHEISFGIIDIANRIYLAAQVKAIETGMEVITDGMLRSAYRDDFRLVSHIIECLRSGDPAMLEGFRDVVITPALPIQKTETPSEAAGAR
jgi:AAA domain-containing protein